MKSKEVKTEKDNNTTASIAPAVSSTRGTKTAPDTGRHESTESSEPQLEAVNGRRYSTEASVVGRRVAKRSRLFRCKLRVFCALHRPVGLLSRSYHYFFFVLIAFSCIVFNIFEAHFDDYAFLCMTVLDSCLTGWGGKYQYLHDYGPLRALDVIGLLTFCAFIWAEDFTDTVGILLRLLHVLQIFQLYRLMLSLLRLMISTIVDQFQQLTIAFIFASIILVLISQSMFLYEWEDEDNNVGIFDAFWFGYITLTTVGYGDITPKTKLGRAMTCVLAFCGICIFQLPANIFGTGLAIKLKEQQKTILFRGPASKLMLSLWRCYATEGPNSRTTCV
ncbi:unnamed protein product, partial [Medioppia subpectinata]